MHKQTRHRSALRGGAIACLAILLLAPPADARHDRPREFPGLTVNSSDEQTTLAIDSELGFTVTRDGVQIGAGTLPEPAPARALVSRSGDRIVLLDTWVESGTGDLMRMTDGSGTLVTTRSLDSDFPNYQVNGMPMFAFRLAYRAMTWISEDRQQLALVRPVQPDHPQDREEDVLQPVSSTHILVLSLETGQPVDPWGVLADKTKGRTTRGRIQGLFDTPGALPVEPGTLETLYARGDDGFRSLALALAASRTGEEVDAVHLQAVADCSVSGPDRFLAARRLLEAGDDRAAPVLLLAVGVPRGRAFKGRAKAGLCLEKPKTLYSMAVVVPTLPELLGDDADSTLVRLVREDDSHGQPTATAALELLLDRGARPKGFAQAVKRYLECEYCGIHLRERAQAALEAD